MTAFYPQQPAPPLTLDQFAERPKISVRGLAHLMSRRMILANLTDHPISLAQFNCLMAEHAPDNLKQRCLMYQAFEAVCDPLLAVVHSKAAISLTGAGTRFPDFDWLMPHHAEMMYAELSALVDTTINTLAMHHSGGFGDPYQITLPVRYKIKPLPPEEAAWQWTEAMEKLLAQPAAKAG